MPSSREKFAEYLKTPKGAAAKKRAYTKYNRSEGHVAANRRWRKRNKEKAIAHGIVAYHIIKGLLVTPDLCEDCNETAKLHAHHEDYSKPLDIEWLCSGCHKERHK